MCNGQLWDRYERGPAGVWVRGRREDMTILLEWQPHHRAAGMTVQRVDLHGEVCAVIPLGGMVWDRPWVGAGTIPIDDAFVAWAGVAAVDACAAGALAHAVVLLADGWGEAPEEVAPWFADVGGGGWLVADAYDLVRECAPLVGLVGARVLVDQGEDGPQEARVEAGGGGYALDLKDPAVLRALLCAAEPERA